MSISGALNIAVSGLASSGARFGNAATNIANARSVAAPLDEGARGPGRNIAEAGAGEVNANGERVFRPQEVQAVALETGGVQTRASLVDPASLPVFNPSAADANADGFSARPNVSIVDETVNLTLAQRQFEANLAVVRTGDALLEDAIDILA